MTKLRKRKPDLLLLCDLRACHVIITVMWLWSGAVLASINGDFYSQTIYLHKYKNPISQNKITIKKKLFQTEVFTGLYIDQDRKTNVSETFTDAQVSPLAGIQSHVFGPSWLYSRAFIEGRFVYRTVSFTDARPRETYEIRSGLLGYGIKVFPTNIFLENYYSLFFTRLYGEKVISQGWARQGYRIIGNFEILNEVFFDSFDQTRDRDGTFDLRPGLRYIFKLPQGSLQLLHQYLHHFTNLEFSGRNEHRSSLVIGLYF